MISPLIFGWFSSTDILSHIDNYGLLSLDLAWCYFKMRDISFLKEAHWRLTKVILSDAISSTHIIVHMMVDNDVLQALECLERSHGKNFERLAIVKVSECHCRSKTVALKSDLLKRDLVGESGSLDQTWFCGADCIS